MADETIDQIKKMRVIEHVELAVSDLQKYQSSPIVVNTMIQLHDALVLEYNSLYTEEKKPAVEDEGAHPTTNPPEKKPEKKS
jgi:hypothetical protein